MRIAIISMIFLTGCSVIGREAEGSYPPVVSYAPINTVQEVQRTDDPIVGDWGPGGGSAPSRTSDGVIGDWGSNGGLAPE